MDVASGLTDLAKLAEGPYLHVLREILALPNLRNLNATERTYFPAIDLADDVARVAIQVTATAGLPKVKETLKTFFAHSCVFR